MSSKPCEQLVAEWAQRLRSWGLADLAQLLMPALKPMGPLVSQAMWVGQPVASPLIGQTWSELALLLEEPGALDRLEQQLESDGDPSTR